MKIVRIIARLNIGGPARNAVLLTEGFHGVKGEGWRVDDGWETVLVCGEVRRNEGDMMYLAEQKGIKPVVVEELGREISWRDDLVAFWKIYRIICREMPDIIHTHTAKAGTLGRLAGMLYRLTGLGWRVQGGGCILVHTFHGHVLHSYFGRVKTLFFIWIEKILALFTDRIIAVSEELKKELVEKYRIAPERKFSVVDLGLELNELLALPPRENNEVVNIGIVGRLVPVKNHKMLLDVIRDVGGRHACPLHKVIIIGDGEMREELGRYARELGIQDAVEFKGWVKDLNAIYDGLDIVVLTSLNEGTPVSLIEAMAAGRPVVATSVGGVPDIVQDGKNGYLVKSGDEEDFSKKLLDLIRAPEKRKMFGQNGRNAVKERFAKERLIKDIERLYNNTLQKNIAK